MTADRHINGWSPRPTHVGGPLIPTADQQARRARIVRAARALAVGGYGAVNMRTVAQKSDVAPATVYYYFPSKEHLLVTCLYQWLVEFQMTAVPDLASVVDPYDRLLTLVDRLNATLCATAGFADAVARAYLFADETVGVLVEDTRAELSEMLADAMGVTQATRHHLEVGELIADVWAANVLAVVHRRATVSDLRYRLGLTVEVIRHRRYQGSCPDVATRNEGLQDGLCVRPGDRRCRSVPAVP